MDRTALIVMLKSPVLGQVKTRLAADVGNVAALQVYHGLLAITLRNARDSGFDIWVAVAGHDIPNDWQEAASGVFLQQGQDLGMRMAHAVHTVLQHGYSQWLIIGGDCPSNTGHNLRLAAQLLEGSDGVIGGTEDGGYYLLGMRQYYPAIFENITWGTDHVYDQTLAQAHEKSWQFVHLPLLRDVDTIADLYANHLGYLLSNT